MEISEIENFKEMIDKLQISNLKKNGVINELISLKLFLEDYINIFSNKDFIIKERKSIHFSNEDEEYLHENKCPICNRLPLSVHIHHIDGNHDNNSEENIIGVCSSCHFLIHSNREDIKKEILINVNKYRNLILK